MFPEPVEAGAALSVASSERRETPPERRSEGEQFTSAAIIARTRTWKMRFLRENILTSSESLEIYLFVSWDGITLGLELVEI